jgi:hypothetical protein
VNILSSDPEKKNEISEHNQAKMGVGIAIGVGVGAPIGNAMGNIGMGIAIGVAFGAVIGRGLQKKSKSNHDKNKSE